MNVRRRINPVFSETADIVRVVRRLEEAIQALNLAADALPLMLARHEGNAAESAHPPRTISHDTKDGEDDTAATGGADQGDPQPGGGGVPPSA